MTHALMAIALYRAASSIEALADFCQPPVTTILKPLVATLNRIADWHHTQAQA